MPIPLEHVHVFTHQNGAKAILPDFFDPLTHEKLPIGDRVLVAGRRHPGAPRAASVVMSQASFYRYIGFHQEALGDAPMLPHTSIPIEFACRVSTDGSYTSAEGNIKDVIWPLNKVHSRVRRPSDTLMGHELLDRCWREPTPVFEPEDELITPPTRRRLSVQPEPEWPTVKGHASVPPHLNWPLEGPGTPAFFPAGPAHEPPYAWG